MYKLWKSWSTCTVSLKFQGQPFLPTLLHPFILWSASEYWYKNTLSTGYRFFWHYEQKYGMYCFTYWYPIFQTCDNPDLMPMQLWPKLISLWFLVTCSVVLPLVTQLFITCSLMCNYFETVKLWTVRQRGNINPLNICWVLDSILLSVLISLLQE